MPATIAVVEGRACLGLDDEALSALAARDDAAKCGIRDLAPAAASGGWGGTTVAATAHLAARAGIRVFATGGLGGVHRGARDTWDESADLEALARTGIVVVCAGVKSILDVGATLERLETLNVTVVGYRTDRFPGFYLSDSGHPVPWRVESVREAAALVRAREEVGTEGSAVVVANPLPADEQLDPELHDRVRAAGLAAAGRDAVSGKDAPVPPRSPGARDPGRQPRGERAAGAAKRAPGRRDRARARRVSRIVVLGDLMVDVLVRLSGPLAPGSDAAASISFHGGGSAANTAAWLAPPGRRRCWWDAWGTTTGGGARWRSSAPPASTRASRWTTSCQPGHAWCSWDRTASGRWRPTPGRTTRSRTTTSKRT